MVGESGCGKSTVGKSIVQLHKPASGAVSFEGRDLAKLSGSALRGVRPHIQMIFQDPISSLNPRRKVFDLVEEPLKVMKVRSQHERAKRVENLLNQVGISPDAPGNVLRANSLGAMSENLDCPSFSHGTETGHL